MSKWIDFEDAGLSPSGKTRRWRVVARQDGGHLGDVWWYPGWRRYVFGPTVGTLFEQDCLRDIAAFIEDRTREHKAAPAEARPPLYPALPT